MTTALREIFASFGVQVDDAPLDRAHDKLERTKSAAEKFGAAIEGIAVAFTASAVAQGVASFAARISATASSIVETSYQLGVSADALQRWRYAATSSGTTAEVLDAGLRSLSNAIGNARLGSRESAAVFEALGVALDDPTGAARDASAVLEDVGVALSGIEDAALRGALAQRAFGRQGRALLPIFAGGRRGVAALRQEFDRLGGGMGKDALAAAKELGDEVGRLRVALTGADSVVATRVIPALSGLVRMATDGVAAFGRMVANSHALEVTLGVLGTAFVGLAIRAGIANLPLLLFGAGIAATILIADDLFTMLSGGKSVFGEFAQEVLGVDVANAVQSWNDAVEAFIGNIVKAYEWVSTLGDRAEAFGRRIGGAVLGTAQSAVGAANTVAAPVARFASDAQAAIATTVGPSRDVARATAIAPQAAVIARPSAGGGAPSTTNTINSPITIDARGSDPREVARVVREEHARVLRDAQAALEQEGGD